MPGDREHKFVNLSFKCFVIVCIINSSLLLPICLSTGLDARADGSIDTATKSNDIKFDPNGSGRIKALDGDGKGKLDGRQAVEEDICSVYHQVCSIHYSLSILGYSLLNYESKPVLSTYAIPTSSTRASDESNNNPRECKKEEDALFVSENPTHSETTEPEHEKGKRREDQGMNKISSNDKHGSLHEYSPPSSKKEERLREEYRSMDKVIEAEEEKKSSCEKGKRMEHKEEELQIRRTYSSPSLRNGYTKRLHGNSLTLSTSLLEAITLLFDSFFSWSFCTFALVLYYYMIRGWSKKEEERTGGNVNSSRRSHNNDPVLKRSKSTVSGDLSQNRTVEVEAVKGENEQDDFNEVSIHAILNEILMKVHMMDSQLELVVNGLLRVLLVWKTLIKVIPDDDNQKNENEQKNGEHKSNPDNDETESINQRNEKFQNLVEEEGLFGQSILDTSDSQLVPDFSSDEEEGEADMDVEEETEDGEEEVHSTDFEYGME